MSQERLRKLFCWLKACEKWRVDAECCTAMVSRLNDERQQAAQQADEVRP